MLPHPRVLSKVNYFGTEKWISVPLSVCLCLSGLPLASFWILWLTDCKAIHPLFSLSPLMLSKQRSLCSPTDTAATILLIFLWLISWLRRRQNSKSVLFIWINCFMWQQSPKLGQILLNPFKESYHKMSQYMRGVLSRRPSLHFTSQFFLLNK